MSAGRDRRRGLRRHRAVLRDGERVLIVIRFEGTSTGAGAPFIQRWVYVYDFAESGRISRWRVFGDLDEARRTAKAPD